MIPTVAVPSEKHEVAKRENVETTSARDMVIFSLIGIVFAIAIYFGINQ